MKAFVLVAVMGIVSLAAPAALAQQTSATLAQQRADAAGRVVVRMLAQYAASTATIDDVGTWIERWYQAKKDGGARGAVLLAAAQEWSLKTHALETSAKLRVQSGLASSAEVDKAAFYRLEADGEVARLRNP